jgi:hypothetical protein
MTTHGIAVITSPFQKSKDREEVLGFRTSIKEVKLHTPEAKRNMANTLSTRLLACCKTSINKAVKARQLRSGIKAHKFILELLSDN